MRLQNLILQSISNYPASCILHPEIYLIPFNGTLAPGIGCPMPGVILANINNMSPSYRRPYLQLMAFGFKKFPSIRANSKCFIIKLVGYPLVMKTGRRNSLLSVHVENSHIQEAHKSCCNYARTSCGSQHHANVTVFGNNGRGHAAQHSFAGLYGVGLALYQTEHVGFTRLCGEVIHFVVRRKRAPPTLTW